MLTHRRSQSDSKTLSTIPTGTKSATVGRALLPPTATRAPKPPKPAPRKPKDTHKRCRALYDCPADNVDELGFKRGEVIVVLQEHLAQEDDNWMEGFIENEPWRRGLFPTSFVTFER